MKSNIKYRKYLLCMIILSVCFIFSGCGNRQTKREIKQLHQQIQSAQEENYVLKRFVDKQNEIDQLERKLSSLKDDLATNEREVSIQAQAVLR